MNLLLFLLLLSLVFAFSVLGVKKCKNYSVKEATLTCKNFVKEIINTLVEPEPKPEPVYPVLVGYTGYGFNLSLVDAEFSKIRENFSSCYCTQAAITSNGHHVIYIFDILRKPDTLDDDTLTKLIQKQSEEVLAKNMRLYGCYLPAEPLTLVELFPNIIRITFARTNTGVKQIAEYKRNIQRRKIMENRSCNGSMKEKWSDNE